MGRIPNYLRTITNKYKGLITEKVALNYFRKKGFVCERYVRLIDMAHTIETLEELLQEERLKRDLKKYSSKLPPKDWEEYNPHLEWEEWTKKQLECIKGRLEYRQELRNFEDIWGRHLKPLKKYKSWLREDGHYVPDLVAGKDDQVFIVEVKSQGRGKTSLFGEYQKQALLKAYDFGLIPMLLVVPLNLNIEVGEPQLKVIEKSSNS